MVSILSGFGIAGWLVERKLFHHSDLLVQHGPLMIFAAVLFLPDSNMLPLDSWEKCRWLSLPRTVASGALLRWIGSCDRRAKSTPCRSKVLNPWTSYEGGPAIPAVTNATMASAGSLLSVSGLGHLQSMAGDHHRCPAGKKFHNARLPTSWKARP